jgi:hypothetical protein
MSPNESAEVAAIPNDDDGLSPPPTFGDDNNDMASQTSAEAAARRRKYRKFTLTLLLGTMLLSTIVTAVRYYGNRNRNDDNNLSSQQQGDGSGDDEEGSDTAMVMTNGLDVEANTARIRQTLEFLISSAASASSTFSQGYDDTDTSATNDTANTADANNSDNFNFNNNNDNSESELTAMTDGTYTPQYAAALWIAKYDELLLDIPSTSSSSSSTSSTASTAEEDEYYYPFLQRYALTVLYFALSGPHGLLCDGSNLNDPLAVTGISLPPMNNMSGTLPVEIRHLQYIKWLQIDKNINITGPIPYEMGTSMTDLQVISITECGLTGSIPSSLHYYPTCF